MRTLLLALLLSADVVVAESPPKQSEALPKTQGWAEVEANWRSIEPTLFTPEGAKKSIGQSVRFDAKPVSLHPTVILKLPSGTIARLVHVQGADWHELATFRKPPTVITADGTIVPVDLATHTVTINAMSTSFQ